MGPALEVVFNIPPVFQAGESIHQNYFIIVRPKQYTIYWRTGHGDGKPPPILLIHDPSHICPYPDLNQ